MTKTNKFDVDSLCVNRDILASKVSKFSKILCCVIGHTSGCVSYIDLVDGQMTTTSNCRRCHRPIKKIGLFNIWRLDDRQTYV